MGREIEGWRGGDRLIERARDIKRHEERESGWI